MRSNINWSITTDNLFYNASGISLNQGQSASITQEINFTNYCFNTTDCDAFGNCASANFSFYTASNSVQSGGGGGGSSNSSNQIVVSWAFCTDDQNFTGYDQRNSTLCSLEETKDSSGATLSANASSVAFTLSNATNYNISIKLQPDNTTNTKIYCKTPFSSRSGSCRYNIERQGVNETAIKVDSGGFSKTCNFGTYSNVTVNIEVDALASSTRACVDLCSGCTSWQSVTLPSGDYIAFETGSLANISLNVQPFRIFNVTVYNPNATSSSSSGGGTSTSSTPSNIQNLVYD